MNNLKTFLNQQLADELPGTRAHQEAAPYRKVDFDNVNLNSVKKSGVLVLFYKKDYEFHLVLILLLKQQIL